MNIRPLQASMALTDSSTDDMDKKLLLSIQSECNAQGVTIPWNNIAGLVGPNITGSAVIQHLAKLRIRMSPTLLTMLIHEERTWWLLTNKSQVWYNKV